MAIKNPTAAKGRKTLPQQIPAKPVLQLGTTKNNVVVFWKQPHFSEKSEVMFGTDLNDLKPLPSTKLSRVYIPKSKIPVGVDHWVKVRGVNKLGAGEWSAPMLIKLKKVAAKPATTATTKKVNKARKPWKTLRLPTLPAWALKSVGRIIGLLLVLLALFLFGKYIWGAFAGKPSVAVPPPIVAVTNSVAVAAPSAPTTSAAPGGKAAVASNGGLAMIDSSIIINNTVTTTTTTEAAPAPQLSATKEQTLANDEVMPNWVPTTQFPPPPEIIGATSEIEVNMGPGEYRNYVLPVLCRPEVFPVYNANVLRPFVNGHLYVPNPYDSNHSYVIRTYGLHNPQQQRSSVRIRLTRIGM